MRLAVYTDYVYRRDAQGVSGERAFVVFVCALLGHVERLSVVGRLNPEPGRSHYPLPPEVGLVALPHYDSLHRPQEAVVSTFGSIRRFWRALDDVDTVWLLGPYLHAIVFVLLAALRRRRIVLGVRQDFPRYTRLRHPDRRIMHVLADLLELSWTTFARRLPTVAVGPDLATRYAEHGGDVLEIAVSLVSERDLVPPEEAVKKSWDGPLRMLSVGRLDPEKNPTLLADVLARARELGGDWTLVVAGDGPLRADLERRLEELGVAEHAELLGYVPVDGGLGDEYRRANAFLHVSWTEGVPQVLFESYAAGLPVVATAVGGVPVAAGDAALLVEPGDAEAPAQRLAELAADPDLRRRLIEAGHERVKARTIESESAAVAEFLATGGRARGAAPGRPAGSPS